VSEVGLIDVLSFQQTRDADLAYRQLDRARFVGSVSSADLAAFLRPGDPASWQPIRGLRAHGDALTSDARAYLIEFFRDEWSRCIRGPADPAGLACLADIVRTTDKTVFSRLPMPDVHMLLPSLVDWATVLYIVLETHWSAP